MNTTIPRRHRRSVYRTVVTLLLAVGAVMAVLLIPASPTGTSSTGAPTTLLGQEVDQAAAAGTLTLYRQSPAPVRRVENLNWYRMEPGTSYYATGFKPYVGWGATYDDASNGGRYTVRCTVNNCPTVYVKPQGMRIVGVFSL